MLGHGKKDNLTNHIYFGIRMWQMDRGSFLPSSNKRNRSLEMKVDHVVDIMANAQLKNGYLNSYFINVEPDRKWTNLRNEHELYCAGHLIEAAVAYYHATGKDKFLNVMRKYADLIHKLFGQKEIRKRLSRSSRN